MATSSVSTHRTRIESQIDARQRLNEAKAEMQADAEEEARKRMRTAGMLGEMVAAEPSQQRRLLCNAVKDMSNAALNAFIDMAEDDVSDLDREDSWEAWSLLNSALTTAYTQRNLRGV